MSTNENDKSLYSTEMEQSVLGALMLDNASFDAIASTVKVGDFAREDHGTIFGAIAGIIAAGKPADAITVYHHLSEGGKSDSVGGLAYINALVQNTPSAANVGHYAGIVRNYAAKRAIAAAGDKIHAIPFNANGRDVSELRAEAEAELMAATEDVRGIQEYHEVGPALTRVVENVDHLHHNPQADGIVGTPTGFIDLDRILNGVHGGQLIIVAARPAIGKTSFAMNLAESIAIHEKLPVGVHSMEMSVDDLLRRSIGSVGRIDQGRLKTGRLTDDDWPRFTHAVQTLSDAPIFIDDSAAQTVSEIRAKARRLHRQHGKLGAIVVDYLQLIEGPNPRENRATQISEISRALKKLAKELNAPVIALSQLSRSLESRPNKRPILSDLRESGAIEQDADVVLALYRDEVYNPGSPERGTAECIVLKNRAGSTGTVRLAWRGECTRFDNFIGAQGVYN